MLAIKKYTSKETYKLSLVAIFLILLTLFFGIIIFKTDYLQSEVDELTAKYISFNNAKSTDLLKVIDLSKKNDIKGKNHTNKSHNYFEISGDKNEEFEIVLYSSGNIIDEKYVKYYLKRGEEAQEGNLSITEKTINNGKIIYKGKIEKNNKFRLYMWIDDNYNKDVKNISYEIKIKSK